MRSRKALALEQRRETRCKPGEKQKEKGRAPGCAKYIRRDPLSQGMLLEKLTQTFTFHCNGLSQGAVSHFLL